MTTQRNSAHNTSAMIDSALQAVAGPKLTLAQIFETLIGEQSSVRITAYDGSSCGPEDAEYGIYLKTPQGTNFLVTAPGDLGLARAYISGDLEIRGGHEGDPYGTLKAMSAHVQFKRPSAKKMAQITRSLPPEAFLPVTPPPQEARPSWRRIAEGLRHSKSRDSEAITHHYDVSNEFYEYVLGPSMTYTCAVYPSPDATLDEAQENKYRLIFEKLRLQPGDRLLDIGCGWGGMVRYAARRGVHALGVTLSREQAAWAQRAIEREGLSEFAEVRHSDYRDVTESGFDAVSSIGLTEHIGVQNYPSYFTFVRDKLKTGGLFLNHCITRNGNLGPMKAGAFIDRYVFPDGELTGSAGVMAPLQDVPGIEVVHEENFREHYALTLRDWCANLVRNWDEALSEVDLGTARVWGLYMAGSRLGFERNVVQLHHILAVKLNDDGSKDLPLRPWWTP